MNKILLIAGFITFASCGYQIEDPKSGSQHLGISQNASYADLYEQSATNEELEEINLGVMAKSQKKWVKSHKSWGQILKINSEDVHLKVIEHRCSKKTKSNSCEFLVVFNPAREGFYESRVEIETMRDGLICYEDILLTSELKFDDQNLNRGQGKHFGGRLKNAY